MMPRKPGIASGVAGALAGVRFALLAGGGELPVALLSEALARGWEVHVISFIGQPQPARLPPGLASHQLFPLGAIGRMQAYLKTLGVTHAALAGHLDKPALRDLQPDFKGMQAIVRLLRGKDWHDDALLRGVATLLVEGGITVLAVADLMPGLLAPVVKKPTALGEVQPSADDLRNVALAAKVLAKVGELDIGQALVVDQQMVVGIEALEGTDALLTRCAPLRSSGHGGLLVKMAKPGQTKQADLPTVGPETLRRLKEQGYRGVVVQGGATVLLAQAQLVAYADKHKLLLLVVPGRWSKK